MNKHFIAAAIVATMAVSTYALSTLSLPAEDGGRLLAGSAKATLEKSLSSLKEKNISHAATADNKLKNASGATILGFLAYDQNESTPEGWYEINTDGTLNLLWEWDQEVFAMQGLYPRGGWLRDNRLCMPVAGSYGGDQQIYASFYMEFNPTTGALLDYNVVDIYENVYSNFIVSSYVESEDKVYGISVDPDDSKYYFCVAPADDIFAATAIAQLPRPGDRCYAFTYSIDDDCFYGISYFDKLVRIDKDGSITEICNVPLSGLGSSRGGLVYSPLDGCYIYNPQYHEKPSAFYAVYPNDKKFELLHQFDIDKQFVFFLSPDNKPLDAKTPAIPLVKNVEFGLGAKEARVTYTMPEKAHDGTALTGSLTWTASVDNIEFESGTAAAGEEVVVEYNNLSNGRRALQFAATSGKLSGNPAVTKVFAGNDTPKAPANVSITPTLVKWSPVTEGVNKGLINLDDLQYKVYINGVLEGTTADSSLEIALDDSKEITAYIASVVATASGIDSEPGLSNKIIFGKPFDMPMHFEPQASDIDIMTIYNLDGGPDYGVWEYSERWDLPCFSSGWSLDKDADDWLILPAANFTDADKAYRLSLKAACGGTSGREEYLELWIGTSPVPEDMTIPILSKTQIRSTDWETYDNIFAVPEAGAYYVGIHAVSRANQYALIVRDINVEATDMSSEALRAVDNLKVVSTSDADLTATISFNIPTAYLTGKALNSDVVVTVTASAAETVSVSGAPGSLQSLVVPTTQGTNIITVVCQLAGIEGQKSEIQAFTGVDVPDFVENFEAEVSEDNMSVLFTWDAPLKGLNDGYFKTSDIQYYIGEIDDYADFVEEPRLAGTDVFEYTYTLKAGSPLAYKRLAISAGNAAGMSPARWYVSLVVGTPHTPPMEEGFDNMTFKYSPVIMSKPDASYTNGDWDWAQPELVDPAFNHGKGDITLVGYSTEGAAKVRLNLPKFATEAEGTTLSLDLWNGKQRPSSINVYATTYGIAAKFIATIPAGEGWEQHDIELPQEFLGRKWVTISIDASLPGVDNYFILSGYSVSSTTGLGKVSTDNTGSVAVENGAIVARGFEGSAISIITIDGRTIASRVASAEERFTLPQGIYIVVPQGAKPVKVRL
ncbi:MAG: hypothetical protein J1F05_02670 [Muribaculaceae bacterium]|nr:hypothetical protein [Muribaculaceae bacterium]